MTYVDALPLLNVDINDTNNFTYTNEEKQSALRQAWNDPFNVATIWDETTTYSNTDYSYPIPATLQYLKSLYYKNDAQPFPVRLDTGTYESVNGIIYITPEARFVIPDSATLIFRGTRQLTTDDDVADDHQEYILKLARHNLLSQLAGKKVNKFLQNDTTTAEIMAAIQQLDRELTVMRRRFTQAPEAF